MAFYFTLTVLVTPSFVPSLAGPIFIGQLMRSLSTLEHLGVVVTGDGFTFPSYEASGPMYSLDKFRVAFDLPAALFRLP